jgi:type I site-specific restriction-modification system R (restriction) subunit
MRDPKERLRDILEAIAAIDRYRNRERRVFEQMVMGFWSSAGAAEFGFILGSAPGCLPQADKPSPHPHRLDVAPFVNGPPLTIVERKNLDDEQTSASA